MKVFDLEEGNVAIKKNGKLFGLSKLEDGCVITIDDKSMKLTVDDVKLIGILLSEQLNQTKIN